jgi:hypothetical protein
MIFTDKTIRELVTAFERDRKAGKRNEQIVFAKEPRGFGLRLQGDSRTWIVQYRATPTKQRRVKIGPWPSISVKQALARAHQIIGGKWVGEDEQAKRLDRREKDKITLRLVADHYLERQQPRLKAHSFEEIKRYLLGAGEHGYWKTLHGLPIDKVEQPMIASRLRELITGNGPVSAR